MLAKVMYATVFVTDQDKALEYYTQVLGFERRADNALPTGMRFVTVGLPGSELEVVLWPGTGGAAKAAPGLAPGALIVATPDCRKTLAELRRRGAELETPDAIERPDAVLAVVRDPDGNRLVVRENRSS